MTSDMSPPVESSQGAEDEGKHKAEVINLENDYDVLPLCKRLCIFSLSARH